MLAAGELWCGPACGTALALRHVAAGWERRGKICDGGGSRNKAVPQAGPHSKALRAGPQRAAPWNG